MVHKDRKCEELIVVHTGHVCVTYVYTYIYTYVHIHMYSYMNIYIYRGNHGAPRQKVRRCEGGPYGSRPCNIYI